MYIPMESFLLLVTLFSRRPLPSALPTLLPSPLVRSVPSPLFSPSRSAHGELSTSMWSGFAAAMFANVTSLLSVSIFSTAVRDASGNTQ